MLLKITLTLCRGTAKDTCILRSPTYAFRNIYHPQRSWGKVMFLQASVILLTGGGMRGCRGEGGMRGCQGGVCGHWGCAWLLGACVVAGGWGACVVARGMRGYQGVCMVVGGMHGCWGVCMAAGGRGYAWLPGMCMVTRGMCVVVGGMRGCWGECVVARGHAWLLEGACIGYDEIRSMSGRYASYWNAF